ncbi:hypothetical protein DJ030_15205 [bacterium endosymbiont of Escarpia laminata]|nr:MAG: hypothetical protein DJ030_15205 [bacterium endosymbiont of Escarpia laminata]
MSIGRISRCNGTGSTMLLMAAAVFLFLIVAGVPAFSQLNENETTAKEAGSITDHLQFAHQEAIRRGLPVTVCASGDGETCNDAENWGEGCIVFIEVDGAQGDLGSSDIVLSRFRNSGDHLGLQSNLAYIQYQADGSIVLY